jgi:hypothetical protein
MLIIDFLMRGPFYPISVEYSNFPDNLDMFSGKKFIIKDSRLFF